MHGQGHPVGPMTLGHGPQRPQGILQTHAQARKILAQTERDVLPIRMGQHEVIEQVRKGQACYGHLQIVHRREVRSRQPTGGVLLREEHLLGWAVLGLPLSHATLEGPPHRLRAFPRLRPLQPLPKRLGL